MTVQRQEFLGADYFGTIFVQFFDTKESAMKPAAPPRSRKCK